MLSSTIGSTKLWLPSRKSVASQRGGLSIVLEGHCRFSSFKGGNFRYLVEGSLSLGMVSTSTQTKQFWNVTRIGIVKCGLVYKMLLTLVCATSHAQIEADKYERSRPYSIDFFLIICANCLCSGWVIAVPAKSFLGPAVLPMAGCGVKPTFGS